MKGLEGILSSSWELAGKLNNDIVSEHHFMFVYNNFREQNAPDFKISLSAKKEILKVLKKLNRRTSTPNEELEFLPLSKFLEGAIQDSKFQKIVFGDKSILPRHVYAAMLINEGLEKKGYMEILEQFHIKKSRINSILITLYFNPFLRRIRFFKLFL